MIILITGASTGIGAAAAELTAPGNTVLIHYNSSKSGAEEAAARVKEAGGTAHLIQADLTDREGCARLTAAVKEKTDKLDVLINNAGGLVQRQALGEIQWSLMEKVFTLNTFSLIQITSDMVPLLRKAEAPHIVNISSIVARHGAAGATLYGAAKGAVDTFTRGAAKELAPHIRVNAIAPGVIDTPFHHKVSTPEQMENWKNLCPLQMNGAPADIAEAIRFFMESRFITGECLDINGGSFMR